METRVDTVWELWDYDVWGNAEDGYFVNDRFCRDREYHLTLKVVRNNPGTDQEFLSAYPSDRQIRAAFGLTGRTNIMLDGDDITIYVTLEHDGYPIGEMVCVSHVALSPISEE